MSFFSSLYTEREERSLVSAPFQSPSIFHKEFPMKKLSLRKDTLLLLTQDQVFGVHAGVDTDVDPTQGIINSDRCQTQNTRDLVCRVVRTSSLIGDC
jgi:hypothetical protein